MPSPWRPIQFSEFQLLYVEHGLCHKISGTIVFTFPTFYRILMDYRSRYVKHLQLIRSVNYKSVCVFRFDRLVMLRVRPVPFGFHFWLANSSVAISPPWPQRFSSSPRQHAKVVLRVFFWYQIGARRNRNQNVTFGPGGRERGVATGQWGFFPELLGMTSQRRGPQCDKCPAGVPPPVEDKTEYLQSTNETSNIAFPLLSLLFTNNVDSHEEEEEEEEVK